MSERPSERLGDRLAYYRKLAGLSAEALARKVPSMSRSVIANIESGRKRDVTLDELIALAWALDIPPVALALPLDRPQTFIRTSEGDTTTYTRAYDLIDWFKTGKRASGPRSASPASTLANLRVAKIEEYLSVLGRIRQAEARLNRGDTKDDWSTILRDETLHRDELIEELHGLGVDVTGDDTPPPPEVADPADSREVYYASWKGLERGDD